MLKGKVSKKLGLMLAAAMFAAAPVLAYADDHHDYGHDGNRGGYGHQDNRGDYGRGDNRGDYDRHDDHGGGIGAGGVLLGLGLGALVGGAIVQQQYAAPPPPVYYAPPPPAYYGPPPGAYYPSY